MLMECSSYLSWFMFICVTSPLTVMYFRSLYNWYNSFTFSLIFFLNHTFSLIKILSSRPNIDFHTNAKATPRCDGLLLPCLVRGKKGGNGNLVYGVSKIFCLVGDDGNLSGMGRGSWGPTQIPVDLLITKSLEILLDTKRWSESEYVIPTPYPSMNSLTYLVSDVHVFY
jgi:hypothetical protein